MRANRDMIGYLLGFVVFVVAVPAIMWAVSGEVRLSLARVVIFALFSIAGLGLSVWSIAYMRTVGKGNPMDAFNHELAPRTTSLMTEGPYEICRNPMLLGVLLYYLGVVILLSSVGAAVVYAIYALILAVQVSLEEKRLERDFGQEYLEYKKHTKRLIPFVW